MQSLGRRLTGCSNAIAKSISYRTAASKVETKNALPSFPGREICDVPLLSWCSNNTWWPSSSSERWRSSLSSVRCLSTRKHSSSSVKTRSSLSASAVNAMEGSGELGANPIDQKTLKLLQKPFYTKPAIVTAADGRKLLAFRTGYHPRLKPRLVARRLRNCRTYLGTEKNIKGSPWKLNIVCQFVAGMPLEEALLQLEFSKKGKAPIVAKVLRRTSNLADIRHGVQKSALEVAECFSTKAKTYKRINIHGRGRHGILHNRFGHMRVVLREIDFQLRIYQARSTKQKTYWYKLQLRAEKEAAQKAAEREEMERLEREDAKKAQLNKT